MWIALYLLGGILTILGIAIVSHTLGYLKEGWTRSIRLLVALTFIVFWPLFVAAFIWELVFEGIVLPRLAELERAN